MEKNANSHAWDLGQTDICCGPGGGDKQTKVSCVKKARKKEASKCIKRTQKSSTKNPPHTEPGPGHRAAPKTGCLLALESIC